MAQEAADDTGSLDTVELMAAVAVSGFGGVQFKSLVVRFRPETQQDRIVTPLRPCPELLGPLVHGAEQLIDVPDRSVVEVGGCRPDPIQGTALYFILKPHGIRLVEAVVEAASSG
jgi:hypothetical protein